MARRKPAPRSDGVARAITYAQAVVSGEAGVCRYVQLACRRFLDDLAAAEAGTSPWQFRGEPVEAALLFSTLMPNIKGPHAGKLLALMDWQRFIYANLFGFYERDTHTRRFRQGVVFVPKGNGKATLSAPISLYLTFVEGEGGAEAMPAAVTRDQARILFNAAKEMVRRSPVFQGEYGVQALANAIAQDSTASKFVPISSDAKALDGLNVHLAVCDEIGSYKTPQV